MEKSLIVEMQSFWSTLNLCEENQNMGSGALQIYHFIDCFSMEKHCTMPGKIGTFYITLQ